MCIRDRYYIMHKSSLAFLDLIFFLFVRVLKQLCCYYYSLHALSIYFLILLIYLLFLFKVYKIFFWKHVYYHLPPAIFSETKFCLFSFLTSHYCLRHQSNWQDVIINVQLGVFSACHPMSNIFYFWKRPRWLVETFRVKLCSNL